MLSWVITVIHHTIPLPIRNLSPVLGPMPVEGARFGLIAALNADLDEAQELGNFFFPNLSGLWIWALREKKKTGWHLHQTCFRRVSSKSNVYCKSLATFGTPIALILIENDKFLFRRVMVSIFLIASCLPQWTHSSSSCLNIFKVYFSLKYLRQNWGDYLFNCDFRTKLKMKKMWNKVSIKLRCVEISSKPRVDGLHGSWPINLNMSSTCEEKSRPRNYFESQMSP